MQTYDIAGYHLRGLVRGFAALDLDVEAMLREADIPKEALDDTERRFSEPQMGQLWMAAGRRWKRPEPLGLIVGTRIPFGALELIDYLIVGCKDVRESIETLVRYAALCASGFHYTIERIRLDDDEAFRIRLHHRQGIELVPPTIIEYLWTTLIWRFREHGNARFQPLVHLRHPPQAPLALYRQILGAVHFDQKHDELYVPVAQWALENPRRDPMLSSLLTRHANDVLERSVPKGGFLEGLRATIADAMRLGDVSIERTASRLDLTARTLQRRLAEQGCVYKTLVEEVRFEMARKYLTSTKLSLAEVSDLLAYSEQRAFQRAFLRWSGLTPAAYREAHRSRS